MPEGRYLTAERDVLAIEVIEAERARPPRRPREADEPASRPVAVALATHVRMGDGAQARVASAREHPAEAAALVADALAVLNVAVRAARAATADPYLVELTAADPRAVRIGTSAPDDMALGRWGAAFEPETARAPRQPPRAQTVRVTQEVAESLAGRLRCFEAEELALRALADLAHGRPTAAAHQARAAHVVMRDELGGQGEEPALPANDDETEVLARHVLETAAAHRARQLEDLRG